MDQLTLTVMEDGPIIFFYLYYLPIIPDDDHVVVGIDRVRDTQLRERGFENGSLMALVAHPQSHAHARFQ